MNSKPNIIILFTDDQRFNTINALGNKEVITPNLDRLVANGTTFTHAHIMGGTCGAVCMPSRAMLMTGKTLFNLKEDGGVIPTDDILMPEHLRRNGYNTFGTGKWHNSPAAYHRSFDDGGEIYFGGMADHWNLPSCDFNPDGVYPEPKPIVQNMHLNQPDETYTLRYDHVQEGKHSTDLISNCTIDYINGYNSDKPFFIYTSFLAPHDPRTMPQKYLDMYDINDISLPQNFKPQHEFDNGELQVRDEVRLINKPMNPDELLEHIREYYAMITHVDDRVGMIIESLKTNGYYDNTIIIFAGDNGLAVGQHGLVGKQNLYDHSVRIPLIMCGPGINKSYETDALCYLLDIFPTLCDMLNLDSPSSIEGISFRSLLDSSSTEPIRDHIFCAYRNFQRSVRKDNIKLIRYNVDGVIHNQLFDINDDPWELKNLYNDKKYEDIQKKLLHLLTEAQLNYNDPLL